MSAQNQPIQFDSLAEKVKKKHNLKNIMQVPRIKKVIVNVGLGEAVQNKKVIEESQRQIAIITGQKPVVTKARKSIATFKIRKGFPNGVKTTLRGKRMNFFLEKLVTIIIPRIKDFKGISVSCVDQSGNLNIGLKEQTIFPEVEYDQIDRIRGLQVTLVTSINDRDLGKTLFEEMGIKFLS